MPEVVLVTISKHGVCANVRGREVKHGKGEFMEIRFYSLHHFRYDTNDIY